MPVNAGKIQLSGNSPGLGTLICEASHISVLRTLVDLPPRWQVSAASEATKAKKACGFAYVSHPDGMKLTAKASRYLASPGCFRMQPPFAPAMNRVPAVSEQSGSKLARTETWEGKRREVRPRRSGSHYFGSSPAPMRNANVVLTLHQPPNRAASGTSYASSETTSDHRSARLLA